MAHQYIGVGRLNGTTQSVAYTATAGTITNPISPEIFKVRVMSTTDVFLRISDGTPIATTSDAYLPGLQPEYFICTPGQKVSAVQVSASGTLYVSEITS